MKNLFLAFLLSFLAVPYIVNAQKEKIELNLKTGETYYHGINAEVKVDGEYMDQDIGSKILVSSLTEYKVISVAGDIYELEGRFKKMKTSISNAFISLNMDSEAGQDGDILRTVLNKLVKGIIDKPFKVFLKKNGEVETVEGYEKVVIEAFKNAASDMDNVNQDKMNEVLQNVSSTFSNESIKTELERAYNIYPEDQVEINDSWKKKLKIQSVAHGRYNVVFTYIKKTKEDILIEAVGKLKTENKDAEVKVQGNTVRYDMKGEYYSEYKLDAATGWIKDAKIVFRTDGDMTYDKSKAFPNGAKIDMVVTGETNISN